MKKKFYLYVLKNGVFFYLFNDSISNDILNDLNFVYIKCLDDDTILVDRLYKK